MLVHIDVFYNKYSVFFRNLKVFFKRKKYFEILSSQFCLFDTFETPRQQSGSPMNSASFHTNKLAVTQKMWSRDQFS